MEYIKGESRQQTLLMPESIEDYVSTENPVRVLDAFVNNLDLAALGFVKTKIKDTGRPPYDPKDLLKLYMYGYINRIRSSRRLEKESKRNLETIWLLQRLSPDHKTIANFRKDNAKALKSVFHAFVKMCIKLDLYGRELAAIDGSKFKAVNSMARNFSQERLEKRIAKIDEGINKYLQELKETDEAEDTVNREKSAVEINGIVKKLNERKDEYLGYIKELEKSEDKQMSLTDKDSRLMPCNGKWDVCYNVQTATDSKHRLVIDFEVGGQRNDMNLITPMMGNVQEILETQRIAAVTDGGYDNTNDILAARKSGVDVHVAGTDFDVCIPAQEGDQVPIQSHKNGRCAYVAQRNIVLCPMGNVLYPASYKKYKGRKGATGFRNHAACVHCTCKCNVAKSRRFVYDVSMPEEQFSKEYNDQDLTVKQIRIKADKELVKKRKGMAEHPFGIVKRGMDGGYCLTRGLEKVRGEFALTFLAYNIKRAINIFGCGKLLAAMASM
jgi:transposase